MIGWLLVLHRRYAAPPLPLISSQQADAGVHASVYDRAESVCDVEPHAQINSDNYVRGSLAAEVLHSQ